MPEMSNKINLCYGAFFKVLASFKKGTVNNWKLHHRLMNVEYIPFGDSDGAFHFRTNPKRFDKTKNDFVTATNPSQAASEFANCKKTRTLPIQGGKSEQRFMEQFRQAEARVAILDYMKKEVLGYLENHQGLIQALIEMLGLTFDSEALRSIPFHINKDSNITTMKAEIVATRTKFNASAFVAGIFHYIMVHCPNNMIGNDLPKDADGNAIGVKIEKWGKKGGCAIPNGSGVKRSIELVEDDSDANEPPLDDLEGFGSGDNFQDDTADDDVELPVRNGFYNLFVVGSYDPNEPMSDKGYIFIESLRALTEYIADEPKRLFTPLSDDTIKKIKLLPSIFLCENRLGDYPNQEAYYGVVTGIRAREDGVNVHFKIIEALSQRKLNDIAQKLAINKSEFTRTHWTIKQADLLEELASAKIMPADEAQAEADSPKVSSDVKIAFLGFGETAAATIAELSDFWKDCPPQIGFATVMLDGESARPVTEIDIVDSANILLIIISPNEDESIYRTALNACEKVSERGGISLVIFIGEADISIMQTNENRHLQELMAASSSFALVGTDNRRMNVSITRALKRISQALLNMIYTDGVINLDFDDVRLILSNGRRMIIGFGSASYESRAFAAAMAAAYRPLTSSNIDNATHALISIVASPEVPLAEMSEIARIIQEKVHEEAEIIFGATIDESLDNTVEVTLIASVDVDWPDLQPDSTNESDDVEEEELPHIVHEIPATITKITEKRLAELAQQQNVIAYEVDPDNPALISLNGALLSVKSNSGKYKVLKVPPAIKGDYEVGDDVDEIGSLCFTGCTNITRIIIPETVMFIHGNTFIGCTEL